MTQIIEMGDLRVRKAERTYAAEKAQCKHFNFTMDSNGRILTCDDCSKQLDAYWAVELMAEHYVRAMHRLESAKAEHIRSTEKGLTLKAAQRVEEAWRSRRAVPICPHCREAIFATDGFGDSHASREMALRRRAVRAADASQHSKPDREPSGDR